MDPLVTTEPKPVARQFGINVVTNGAVIVLNILVGLLFTPYLISKLGIASYGLVVLAVSLTGYMSIFETAINSAVGRFLTIDLRKGQFESANRTFNTALWSGLLLMLVLLPAVLVVAHMIPSLFDIPAGAERSARLLFAAVMIAYLLIIIRGIFAASAFSYNRLDLQNTVYATNTIVRIGVVVLLFSVVLVPSAWQVGVGTIAGAAVSLVLAILIWRALTPELRIDRDQFDVLNLRGMFGMSGWLLINQMGSLLFLNIDLIVINQVHGVTTQGRYGAVLQLTILLRTLAAAISTAITPVALKQFAAKDMERMALMTRKAIRWMGLLFALPIGCLVAMSGEFLTLWLGPDFSGLATLVTVMILPLSINLSVLPLFSIQTALNKVRWPGILTLVLGLLNLYLAATWVKWESVGLGVALASAVVLTLKNAIFTPLYGAHIQGLPRYTFYQDMVPGIVAAILVSLVVFGASRALAIDSWAVLIAVVGVVSLLYLVGLFAFALDTEERRQILQLRSKFGSIG